jgi:uncharacterized protein (TIGR03435 family)
VIVDIHASIPKGSTRKDVPEMLKTLLMTRFGLRAHAEPRPTDVYELVPDSGGIRFQEVQAVNELEKVFPADFFGKPPQLDRTQDSLEGRLRSVFTGRGLMIITERSMYERIRTDRGTYELNAARITMAELVVQLAGTVDRPVIDRTKLTGVYQLRIELPPGPSVAPALAAGRGGSTTTNGAPIQAPIGISAFQAVEKLGLKLEPRRILLDTIVVDEIERVPTEN